MTPISAGSDVGKTAPQIAAAQFQRPEVSEVIERRGSPDAPEIRFDFPAEISSLDFDHPVYPVTCRPRNSCDWNRSSSSDCDKRSAFLLFLQGRVGPKSHRVAANDRSLSDGNLCSSSASNGRGRLSVPVNFLPFTGQFKSHEFPPSRVHHAQRQAAREVHPVSGESQSRINWVKGRWIFFGALLVWDGKVDGHTRTISAANFQEATQSFAKCIIEECAS